MRIVLDSAKCQGHGRCYSLAPDLFDSDDEGFAVLLVDGEVPEDKQEDARLAVSNCPEFALDLTD